MSSTRRGCLVLSALLPLLSLLACAVPVTRLGNFLTSVDGLARADAIVVLGGGEGSRAIHAVDLFKQRYAPQVVFSGGTYRRAGQRYSTAQRAQATAQEAGLPANAALLADRARNTYQEAENLHRLAQQEGWHTLIVVTDALHAPRLPHVSNLTAGRDDLFQRRAGPPL